MLSFLGSSYLFWESSPWFGAEPWIARREHGQPPYRVSLEAASQWHILILFQELQRATAFVKCTNLTLLTKLSKLSCGYTLARTLLFRKTMPMLLTVPVPLPAVLEPQALRAFKLPCLMPVCFSNGYWGAPAVTLECAREPSKVLVRTSEKSETSGSPDLLE